MIDVTRRKALLGALVAGFALPAAARAATGLVIPAGPMLLTRRIERGLSGEAKITVERSWNILFAPQGRGCAITGRQSRVEVDAPAALARLAEIERERSTDAMFPILLSEQGTVVAAGIEVLAEDLAQAVREAERMIAARPISAEAKSDQLQHLAQLQKTAGQLLDRLPPDLFFPASPPRHAVETVQLAGGLSGQFEVSYEAQRTPGAPWLARAERRVVTRIDTSERRSSETWTMVPA